VCSTNNGGRTWKLVFSTRRVLIPALIRTSVKAGIVVAGFRDREAWWTRDGGKRWYQTDALTTPGFAYGPSALFMDGGALYFRTLDSYGYNGAEIHSAVFRLDGWVPHGPLSCDPGGLCDGGMTHTRVAVGDFDSSTGTGSIAATDVRLAAGWTSDDVQTHAAELTFLADIFAQWETTCTADASSAFYKSTIEAGGLVAVHAAPVLPNGGDSLVGFAFTGYGDTISGSGFITPPAVGDPCLVSDGVHGHLSDVSLEPWSVVWLVATTGVPLGSGSFELGDFPYPAAVPATPRSAGTLRRFRP
jgi:hypothetical protein